MRPLFASLALAALVAAALVSRPLATTFAQDAAPAKRGESARQSEVRALIARLTSGKLEDRESARARLMDLGQDAVPLLERAAKDPDADRADAAREVLSVLRWKLPKALEAELGKPLEDYPSLKREERLFGLQRLAEHLREARALAPFLANVARFDPDPELRLMGLDLYIALTPQGDPARDELCLEELAQEPPRRELHAPRAKLLLRLGHEEEGLKEARKAAAGDKASPAEVLFLSDALVDAGLASEALGLLDGLAKKAPADVDLQARLGEAYLLAGERAKGEELLARVLKTKISSLAEEKAILLRVARAWMRVGRPEDAQDVLRLAVQKQPYDQQVNVALAELDLAQGRIAAALGRLLNEARYCQRDTEELKTIRADLVKLFEKIGEPEVAKDEDLYEDARRGRPLAKARLSAGRFLLARGLTDEAARLFREAAALDPEGIEARIQLGDALRRLGRDDEARKAYNTALALSPHAKAIEDRILSLSLVEAQTGHAPLAERPGDVLSWDRRFLHEELAGEPESISETAPPPIVAAGKVLLVAPGSLTLLSLDATEGLPGFRLRLEPPPPPEGVEKNLVGLEPAGLVTIPAAAAAAIAPARARDATPLAGVLVNEWVRPANRSWRKARFEAGLLYLVDPKDGTLLDRSPLLDEPLASGSAPVARGSRALVVTQPDEDRANLVLVDLVARRARWKQELAGGPSGRPLFAGDLLVTAFGQGVAGFAADGSLKLTALDSAAPQTGVACGEGALWFAAGGKLERVPLEGGTTKDVASAPEGEAFSGDPAVVGSRVFCGTRGGPVRAYDVASGRVVATMPLDRLDRAAARSLVAAGNRIFALGGSLDSFADELPSLLALDPKDLAIVWRRPLERGALLGLGEGMVVAASGTVRSASGIRVTLARPGAAAVDARPRLLAEMRSAAEDALASSELEVGTVIARRWLELRGGFDLATADDLAFLARAFALSDRKDDAESVLEVARARDASAENGARIDELRRELGLEVDEPKPADGGAGEKSGEKPPKSAPGDKPGPGGQPGGK